MEDEKKQLIANITVICVVLGVIISSIALLFGEGLYWKLNEDQPTNSGNFVSNSTMPIFSDVTVGDWCYDAVTYLFSRNLIDGTNENQFAPEEFATRAMVITVLYRLEGEPAFKDVVAFSDTQWDQYYSNAVLWAASNKIIEGNDGSFYPDDPITREQIASILYRYHVVYKGRQITNTDIRLYMFSDRESVSEYAASSVAWAIQSGLFSDIIYNDAILPECTVTRAQAAVIFMRYCESV